MEDIDNKIPVLESQSAGCVVVCQDNNKYYTLLIYRVWSLNNSGWVLPKGTIEEGETPEQAALRETEEETGAGNLSIVLSVGKYSYDYKLEDRILRKKTVFWYLANAENKTLSSAALTKHEKTTQKKVEWIEVNEAIGKLKFEESKRLLRRAMGLYEENRYFQKYSQNNQAHYAAETSYYSTQRLSAVEIELLRKIPTSATILDAACGAGRFPLNVAKLGYKTIGVDFTTEAIVTAKKLAMREKLKDTHFEVMDLTNLKFADNYFDFVFCSRFSINSIPTYSARKKAVFELYRVTKNRGKIFIEAQNAFNMQRSLFTPLENLLIYLIPTMKIFLCNIFQKKYNGLLPGDIIYKANKVKDAPDGFAHIPTPFEIRSWIPNGSKYSFRSEKEIVSHCHFDCWRYFKKSLWVEIEKSNG